MSSRGGSIRYLYKHTPTPSDTSSASYDHGAIEFLLSYREREKRGEYDELMRLTREKCERILDDMFIKGVVQGRTKKADSLATTLRDLKNEARTTASDDPNETPNFKDWVLRGESIWEHPDMGDLVGIRIGLYFPDDVLRVVQRIEEEFDRKWLFGTVMGGRQPIQSRNVDIQSHANGPWHSLGPGGTAEHWEHYGYKSWQVVVEWPSPLEGIELPRVEIQVGTVVMQAWAEVQHNIIYKRSPFVLATPTMRRMIDGINGLAITTEIMLKQLERDLEAARREADEQSFQSGAELLDWFELTYLGKMEGRDRQNWRKAQREGVADQLIKAYEWKWQHRASSSSPGERTLWPTPCPREFRRLIESTRLVQDGMLREECPRGTSVSGVNRYPLSLQLETLSVRVTNNRRAGVRGSALGGRAGVLLV